MQQGASIWEQLLSWMQSVPLDALFRPADLYVATSKAQREMVLAALSMWARMCAPHEETVVEEEVAAPS